MVDSCVLQHVDASIGRQILIELIDYSNDRSRRHMNVMTDNCASQQVDSID